MEYKSNLDDVVDRIAANLEDIKGSSKLKGEIAQTIMVSNFRRVFEDGKAVNEQKIGRYSTRAMLVGAKSFTTKGKANSLLGSKTKRRKLGWRNVGGNNLAILPGGYKELRRIQGFESNFVNLSYTNKLRSEWAILGKGKVWTIGFRGSYGAKLSRILEAKYGTQIWGVSKQEQAVANKTIENFVKNAL